MQQYSFIIHVHAYPHIYMYNAMHGYGACTGVAAALSLTYLPPQARTRGISCRQRHGPLSDGHWGGGDTAQRSYTARSSLPKQNSLPPFYLQLQRFQLDSFSENYSFTTTPRYIQLIAKAGEFTSIYNLRSPKAQKIKDMYGGGSVTIFR